MIFTAIKVEYEKVDTRLRQAGATRIDTATLHGNKRAAVYRLGDADPWQVYVVQDVRGNIETSRQVALCLGSVLPEIALFIGIAAGRKDARRGHVVVAESVSQYGRGKRTGSDFLARSNGWRPPRRALETAKQVADDLETQGVVYRIHFKPIASGDAVIDSTDAVDHEIIRRAYEDAAAIETEGAGFADAVEDYVSSGMQWLLVRGISDLADGRKKASDDDGWQAYAADHAAQVGVAALVALTRAESADPVQGTTADPAQGTTADPSPAHHEEASTSPFLSSDAVPPTPPPPVPDKDRPSPAGLRRWRWMAVPVLALAVTLVLILQSCGNGDAGHGDPKTLSASPLPGCDQADTTVDIAASVDKSRPLRLAAKAYGNVRAAGRCVRVEVQDKNSGEAMRALVRGWQESDGRKPEVWAPAGTAWLSLARANAKGEAAGLFPKDAESIVTSPLTIAMPKPMAEVLEWPENTFSWSELADWSTHAKGFWGQKNRGRPEWGDFKLGKTNPGYSTSGLNATIGAFYAATGTSAELSTARLDSSANRAFVESIEQSAVHYGDTTLTFLSNLRQADRNSPQKAMSYISAVTLEENTVAAYNAGYPCGALSAEKGCERTTKPQTPLVSFYPKDGILYSDHPYIELSGMDSAQRAVADDFLTHLQSPEVFDEQFAPYGFRTHDGKIRKGSLLLGKGSGVLPTTVLQPLSTPRDDVLKHLLDLWPALRRHANVLLLIDTSGSMNDEIPGTGDTKLERLKRTRRELFAEFTGSDRVGLWKFSDAEDLGGDKDYRKLVPLGPYDEKLAGGTRRKLLSENFEALEAEGATGLNDTLDAATTAMRADYDPKAINAIVLLTDGVNEDRGSLSDEALLRHVGDTSQPLVRVFTIAYGSAADSDDQRGRSMLQKIADAGGGQMYNAKKAETIEEVITSVISNF